MVAILFEPQCLNTPMAPRHAKTLSIPHNSNLVKLEKKSVGQATMKKINLFLSFMLIQTCPISIHFFNTNNGNPTTGPWRQCILCAQNRILSVFCIIQLLSIFSYVLFPAHSYPQNFCYSPQKQHKYITQSILNIDGSVQERCNSIAKALELLLSCTNPSIWWCLVAVGARVSPGMTLFNLPPPWTKWPPFCRRYFQMHFCAWKVSYFDHNFTEVYSWGTNWQQPSIGLDNGLAPNRRQAIIWTNAYLIHWRIYAAIGGDGFTYSLLSCHMGKDCIWEKIIINQ